MPHVLLALVAFVIALASLPARAAPCAGFTDVEDTSPFCVDVAWMRNRGITLGCTATLYCPNDFVTRLQMAAFMYLLGFRNAFLNGGNAFGGPAVLLGDAFRPEAEHDLAAGDRAHLRANIGSILRPPLPAADTARLAALFGHLRGVGLDLADPRPPRQA